MSSNKITEKTESETKNHKKEPSVEEELYNMWILAKSRNSSDKPKSDKNLEKKN